jgi:chemotaxis protein CheD
MGAHEPIFLHDGIEPGAVLFLRPGQWWFGRAGDGVRRITTLLGSCVAVTLWHPCRRFGGMCHFLVPSRPGRLPQLDGRYGDDAVQLLAGAVLRARTAPEEYEVGLYGGANMFADNPRVTIDIGANNAAVARELLAHHRFSARRCELLGTDHRHLTLDLGSGAIALRSGAAS